MASIVYDINGVPLYLETLRVSSEKCFEYGGERFAVMDDVNDRYTWIISFSKLPDDIKKLCS